MATFPTCRVIVEAEANSGAWNMAVDETLLLSALESDVCTLRFYRWKRATLSLGYFQKEVPTEYVNQRVLDVVRRLSGGGAILHHHELTYSIAIPASHPLSKNPRQLYEQVHACIASHLQEHGIPAVARGVNNKLKNEPFLCFSRGDTNDLVVGSHKVLGSAQRRRKGAVLQHGSLLLRRSEHEEQYLGLFDLCPETTLAELPESHLSRLLWPLLAEGIVEQPLSETELTCAQQLAESKY